MPTRNINSPILYSRILYLRLEAQYLLEECVCSSHQAVLCTRRHPAHLVSVLILHPREIKYATYIENLLFLVRLKFLRKTGCLPHYFQYKEITSLFFSLPKISLKFVIIRFLTSVAYCASSVVTKVRHIRYYIAMPQRE